jgi:UTP--glucose-1-phosphate uridylyltransferase
MVFMAKPGVLKQMMEAYEVTGGNIIGVEEVDPADVSSYGIVARGEGPDSGFEITGMVEKPKPADAPSNLFISGRYILQPEIFALLAEQTKGAGGEIQVTDAMQTLMRSQPFTGVKYKGKVFDCGSKIGFLSANVAFALEREDIAKDFRQALTELELERHWKAVLPERELVLE